MKREPEVRWNRPFSWWVFYFAGLFLLDHIYGFSVFEFLGVAVAFAFVAAVLDAFVDSFTTAFRYRTDRLDEERRRSELWREEEDVYDFNHEPEEDDER